MSSNCRAQANAVCFDENSGTVEEIEFRKTNEKVQILDLLFYYNMSVIIIARTSALTPRKKTKIKVWQRQFFFSIFTLCLIIEIRKMETVPIKIFIRNNKYIVNKYLNTYFPPINNTIIMRTITFFLHRKIKNRGKCTSIIFIFYCIPRSTIKYF